MLSAPPDRAGRTPSTATRRRLAAVSALALGLLAVAPLVRTTQAATPPLQNYQRITQWPQGDWPLNTLAGRPAGLAVADDGTVYLTDGTVNRITVMDPSGEWITAFGNQGNGPERLGRPGRVEVDDASGRVFVADNDSYRVVVFDRAGRFLQDWKGINASGTELAPDGLLWLTDVLTNKVRAFDALGQEQHSFGSRGSGKGRFRQLTDVTVSPSGTVFVGDRNGSRVQVFEPDPSLSTGSPYRIVRTLDFSDPKYQRQVAGGGGGFPGGGGRRTQSCSGRDLVAYDDDTLLAYPCIIAKGEVTFLGDALRSQGVQQFFNPAVDVAKGQYYALGIKTDKPQDPRAPRWPVVLRFNEQNFNTVAKVWQMAPFDSTSFRAPSRVDVAANGTVYVTDFRSVFHYSPEGQPLSVLPRETFPTDPLSVTLQIAAGDGSPEGIVGLGTCIQGANSMPCLGYFKKGTKDWKGEPRDYLEVQWTTTLPQDAEATSVHYDPYGDLILLLDNANQKLYVYKKLMRGRREEVNLGGTDRNALYADVASGPDGRLYVLDVLRDEAQVYRADGGLLRKVKVPADAWRIAGASKGTFFVLTAFGEVVGVDEAGAVFARFDARPNVNAQPRNLSDLSVAPDGRVFVADRQASLISVFAPADGAAEVRAGQTCQVGGDKQASPGQVPLGQPVDLKLTLTGSCGSIEQASNVLLLVNTKNEAAFTAARQVLALADLYRHKVGLMGYYVSTVFKQRWTNDPSRLVTALEQLNAGGGSESSEANGLKEALNELKLVPGPGVVVLIGSQYCVQGERVNCQEQQDAEPQAAALAAAGYRVVVVNGNSDSSLLASSDLDVVNLFGGFGGFGGGGTGGADLSAAVPVYQRVVTLLRPANLVKTGTLVDVIPASMRYVPGSAQPAAAWDAAARSLTWQLADAPYAGAAFSYQLEPLAGGRQATNVEAALTYVDGWDGTGKYVFPVPEVEVLAPPTATPTPTASPTPTHTPSPTASPTATPLPKPTVYFAYLPQLTVDRCKDQTLPLDLVLAIDVSSSMRSPSRSGGPSKLAEAQAAADAFLSLLSPSARVGLVAYHQEAAVVSPLTADLDAVRRGLADLGTGQGTRIDRALAAGEALLAGRRADAVGALVLLTDGRVAAGQAEARATAAALRAAGVQLWLIGFGADVDEAELRELAGDGGHLLLAPGAAELAAAYANLPLVQRCPSMR